MSDFNVFLLLRKAKYTNFRAVKVSSLIDRNCFHVKKLVNFLDLLDKMIKVYTSFIF